MANHQPLESIKVQCACGEAAAQASDGRIDIAGFLREQIGRGWRAIENQEPQVVTSPDLDVRIALGALCPRCAEQVRAAMRAKA